MSFDYSQRTGRSTTRKESFTRTRRWRRVPGSRPSSSSASSWSPYWPVRSSSPLCDRPVASTSRKGWTLARMWYRLRRRRPFPLPANRSRGTTSVCPTPSSRCATASFCIQIWRRSSCEAKWKSFWPLRKRPTLSSFTARMLRSPSSWSRTRTWERSWPPRFSTIRTTSRSTSSWKTISSRETITR